MNKKNDIGLLLLRTGIAFTMLIYGITKLTNGIGYIEDALSAIGLPSFIAWGVYIGEILMPILIIAGIRTRLAGAVFAINCIVAILLMQLPYVFKLNENGGWQIGLIFIYAIFGIAMFYTGGGRYAVSRANRWD